jgi:hypothetical protein
MKTRYLLTLKLDPGHNSLQDVQAFPGLKNLEIDENYGVINISPKRSLYVIRVAGEIDPQQLMLSQPQIKGVHGDAKVAVFI